MLLEANPHGLGEAEMLKLVAATVVAAALVFGSASMTIAGGKGGNGGGTVKPVTFRIAGAISKIEPLAGGLRMTIGTSYYATGSALVNDKSKMRINGVQDGVTPSSFQIGDFAEIDVTTAGFAYKIEATR